MNAGETFGSKEPVAPKSSIEKLIAAKLEDKEGLDAMMRARAEHAKFQLATNAFEKKAPKRPGGGSKSWNSNRLP